MRRLLLLFALFFLPCAAHATWGSGGNFTQVVFNNSCGSGTSCSVTVAALGAGHLVFGVAHIPNGSNQLLSGVTAAGETFSTINGGAQQGCPVNWGTNNTGQTFGCGYTLNSVGGATSVTFNFTASVTGASVGVYEAPYTAPFIFLERNNFNSQNSAASTFPGINFSGNGAVTWIQSTNAVCFQLANVASGTISAIDSSYVLDNHTGQVADAHILNYFNDFNSVAPTWTNSGSAASVTAAVCFGEDYNPETLTAIPASTPGGLQVSYGTTNGPALTVISPGLFELVFEATDNWGLAQWYDLVNDPNASVNILDNSGGNGPNDTSTEAALFNRTYYDYLDVKLYDRAAGNAFSLAPKQLSLVEYNASRVVIETKSEPVGNAEAEFNNLIGTTRYYIYPNGQIYVHHVSTVTNAFTFTTGAIFSEVTLPEPGVTITNPPDSSGWIRASTTQNPYTSVASAEPYLFAYWTGTTFTKASVLMVRSPNNLYDGTQILFTQPNGSGPFLRWGWQNGVGNIVLGSGGTIVEDWLIQLGTQGSTVLPNLTTSAVCDPIAFAYIANPTPPLPTSQNILTLSNEAVVNQGKTMQFTATDAGSWTCPSCAGSINSATGLYTAPASVTAQQTQGGYQLLPNNHIFNTRIDSLPQHPMNSTWQSLINVGGGQPSFNVVGRPITYITNATPTKAMTFFYTTANNGSYQIAPFPNTKLEGGYFTAISNSANPVDHHLLEMNTDNGVLSDFYQYYASCATSAASVTNNVATLTCTTNPQSAGFLVGSTACVGGFTGGDTYFNACTTPVTITAVTPTSISYALVHANASAITNGSATLNTANSGCSTAGTCNSQGGLAYTYYDYKLPNSGAGGGATGAAGTEAQPLQMRLAEWNNAVANNGTINHALRVTFGVGVECSCLLWPATAYAPDGATIPFGARLRLKPSFDISGYSAPAQILLKQLQQYGIINDDGGNGYDISAIESNHWPANYIAAANEVVNAGPVFSPITNTVWSSNVATITVANSLAVGNNVLINGTSGGTYDGWHTVASANGTSFTFNQTHADVGSASNSGTVRLGLSNFMEFVDESSLMVSSTSGVTTSNRELVTFTRTSDSATSTVDVALQGVAVNLTSDYLNIMAGTPAQQLTALVNIGGVTWTMNPLVGTLTSTGLYTVPSSVASPTTTTITATSTVNPAVKALLSVTVFPGPAIRILPSKSTNYVDSFGNMWWGGYGIGTSQAVQSGCCADNGSFPAITDASLWNSQVGSSSVASADTRIDMLVPNDVYQVTYRFGTRNVSGYATNKLAVQGSVFLTQDFATASGGANQPYSAVVTNVTVTDNHLRYIIFGAMGGSNNEVQPISSLSIIPGAVRSRAGGLP
ncbi:MAG: hypothetical protein DMG30_07670 [Acidobacteria bacterium]|nr:MAG: hypothetical protein DMG30_07670 [Acidobacteriota bacterium]